MNYLLKYMIPIIIAIAIIDGVDKSDSVILTNPIQDITTEVEAFYSDYSSSDFDIYLPRRVSSTNVLSLQNSPKRANSSIRYNFEFIKSGKVISLEISNFIQKKSQIIHSLFTKPVNRLISIGKLVI